MMVWNIMNFDSTPKFGNRDSSPVELVFLSCADQRNFIRSSFFPHLSDHDVTKLAIAAISLSILTSLGAFISYRRFSMKRKGKL